MTKKLLHTPEGVRDIYETECERKMALEANMMSVMELYAYHPIQTPMFEFFDIFAREIGSTPSKDLYKFFDREGNTLVLRPDITPSIARCASKYYMDETLPLRFSYKGNTFVNNSSLQGRLKEYTQCGAELIGDGSADADAEIIALGVHLLEKAGLREFQISVGHADYLSGLFEAAGFCEETEAEITDRLRNKNFFGVLDIIANIPMDEDIRSLFSLVAEYAVTPDMIREARKKAAGYPKVLASLERIEALNEILKIYKVDRYVSYEFGMLPELTYYTGIIFAGYTFGTGEPIIKGGRYDHLLQYFGKESPATGFAVVVNQLMSALSRQEIPIPYKSRNTWIVYDETHRRYALETAETIRTGGEPVKMILLQSEDQISDVERSAAEKSVENVIYLLGER